MLIRGVAGEGLDPPDVGADRRLPQDDKGPDLGSGVGVGAAAQLGGELADLDQPDRFAVFVAKEGQGPLALGFLFGRDGRVTWPFSMRRWLASDSISAISVGATAEKCEKSKRSLPDSTSDPAW